MRFYQLSATFKNAVLALTVLLLGAGICLAQNQVNLTAGPSSLTMPDGSSVPMWGYSCGATTGATCNPLSKSNAGWSPVVITVPTGQDLNIILTNNLAFPNSQSTNYIPTSLVVVGQLSQNFGKSATYQPSPTHAVQGATWPIAGDSSGATFNPPPQGNRVQSFSTEVATVGATALQNQCASPCTLTWKALNPGTYLIESGTHPSIQGPMGLYGMLVVTDTSTTPATAYPGVTYAADLPLLFSEIDPTLNNGITAAVNTAGFGEISARVLRDSVSSVTVNLDNAGNPIAGSGYKVGDPVIITGGGYSVQATAQVSQIGNNGAIQQITITNPGQGYSSVPTQVTVNSTGGSGAQLTANLSLSGVMCSDGAAACYPPVVNYSPLYYLINGTAFDKTNAIASLFATNPATGVSGNVLVRMVNAGLKMHVPSIVGAQTGTGAGFSLIAEDGNPLPGTPRTQSEVFLSPGKTYDVLMNASAQTTLPVFDRQLSLSGNAIGRDAGMLAYIAINGGGLPSSPELGAAVAQPDTYSAVVCPSSSSCNTLTISDPSKGVIANDFNVYGVQVSQAPSEGTLTLNTNGTFSYIPNQGWTSPDSFQYCGNGRSSGPACTSVTLNAASIEAATGISMGNISYTANTASYLSIKPPGILSADKDGAGYPLSVVISSVKPAPGLNVTVDKNGGFNASVAKPGIYTFTYSAQNSQGTQSSSTATVTITFNQGSGLQVSVVDGKDKTTPVTDYRWIIEEDRTFYINPNNTTNNGNNIVPTFGTNFHTSYMPVVATGCVGPAGAIACESGQMVYDNNPSSPTFGQHISAVCDVGNGVCEAGSQKVAVDPKDVKLDSHKRYYISVLPGDAANAFETGNAVGGHGMGGAPILFPQQGANVTVYVQPNPFPPSKLSVFVFEDDFPLNGEQDGGGGIDVLSPNEPGLGQFNITLFDDAGGTGDATGQMTYDMFNQPLSNSLAGTIDPVTGADACPISKNPQVGVDSTNGNTFGSKGNLGITGTIVTCPKYEADGKTLSPLAGQAVIANLMPGRYGVVATPGADRIARGEEWLQTNTLDGQKAHDSFLRIGEPSFFQEFGPAGYHVSIGFANPAIINARLKGVCSGSDPNVTGNCNPGNTVKGLITTERMSRTPDERLYSSGDNSSFSFTQCYVSFGDPDGEDFAFTKCNADGSFSMGGLPDGDWRVTVFDQWNDMLVDGLSTPVRLGSSNGSTQDAQCPGSASANGVCDLGQIAMNQWQANIYTRTFLDLNGDGISNKDQSGNDTEPGLTLVPTNVRFRDGSFSNFNNTDLNGYANFNEVFPLFSWYVVETDDTRYKNTGTHVVYDAGGPSDGTQGCGQNGMAPCGNSAIAGNMANTYEQNPVPGKLHVPGAVYCNNADCSGQSIKDGPNTGSSPNSTGRIDPPWVVSEGWQGFSGQNSFLEFGKAAYASGENGGIKGHVVYASTRPFDDPRLLLQNSWEPLVPGVTINLYQEGTAPDGSTSLTLVDTTVTSSWDAWAQGFRSDKMPNMNCPGQFTAPSTQGAPGDLFFFTLYNQPMWLDVYNNNGAAKFDPNNWYNAQFKCYDGMHNWNQLQPAPYDGMYKFPSIAGRHPVTGAPVGGTGSVAGTNCTICVANPTDGTPMLPTGKYVVEVVVPPGYELVKEEDKNILIGDNFIAPVTQEFGALGSIFILPDQATIDEYYNGNNPQNPTQNLGRTTLPNSEADTGKMETYWPCVGESRVVPDFISLFPQSAEVAPFAGATRNLCDRKEVTLTDQASVLAKFYIFTSTHAAAHFTGVITDDFTSEFDPFSPQFGEKFSPANLPVAIKDWTGTEISRVYADQWGTYNGLTYSTWEVNPPNPTGYSPTMMVTCMNDPGTGSTPDPLFNPAYSQFCYEIPFMPGQTQYMDTPVVPTSAFAGAGYNNPDCAYPDATPAIASVVGDSPYNGPWVAAAGNTLTVNALGDQMVNNYGYSGPSATAAPFNQKTVLRHYGFGQTQGTGSVTIGGVPAQVTSWSDMQIMVTVPQGIPACAIQQQAIYLRSGSSNSALCGQLVITAGNGKQSIDSITVTVGGQLPTLVTSTIQSAIDNASPGDLIIVPPGQYQEMLLMWKPVRLQGVGAASSIINANTHPAGKLDVWRRTVNCLFGLAMNGVPITTSNPFDPTNTFTCSPNMQFQVDRLPLEATVGWDANLNGNLAEMLQEPSLMGALEGAAITVLSKGADFHGQDPFAPGLLAGFPTGTTLLTAADCLDSTGSNNPFPSNFQCNPSSIDGLGITDSSQGGGGIFVHAWGHNIQIANNRIYNNSGTLSGGINLGQGEFPPAYMQGGTNAAPGSCEISTVAGVQLPYCHNLNVNIHNNAIMLNSSTGDELFSATPAGAGGVSICTGSDYYKFQYNWVCGNLSTGDGGGIGHIGFSKNGDIEHNTIIFNQSTNPTIAANGGGLLVMGAPDADPPCGATTDSDCVPPLGSIGPSDGVGPGLTINANLIMGNAAESGSGGGLRLQAVNGAEVVAFPTTPSQWYSVNVTNNIIANNVAGWDGGGVSLVDSFAVNFVNNTVVSNDTTASSGMLFNTLGAPLASSQGPCPTGSNGQQASPCVVTSTPQPAGLVTIQNSAVLTANLPSTITCPAGHYDPSKSATNGSCLQASYPLLANNLFWQNRSFYIAVGGLGNGTVNQQNTVALYNGFSTNAAASQASTGACPAGSSYWDIGVRGDQGPSDHSSGVTLTPSYSVLTDANDYPNLNNLGGTSGFSPALVSQYCNGSRVPPENGGLGFQVPPGIADATVPNPVFSLMPAATVDEGNNWINIQWGPLALTSPSTGNVLGNYAPQTTSAAVDAIGSTSPTYAMAPTTDFFGNPRPDVNGTQIDIGAVEVQGSASAAAQVSPTSLSFGNQLVATTSAAQTVTLSSVGELPLTVNSITVTGTNANDFKASSCPSNTLTTPASCTINVTFTPSVMGPETATLAISTNDSANPIINVALSGTGIAPVANVQPTSLTFPNTNIGVLSKTQNVTLQNTGTAPLTISSISIVGTNPSDFLQANNCGGSVAINASCSITVSFRPTTSGARSATLSISDNSFGTPNPQTVSLSGTGVGPVLTINPKSLTFSSALNVTSAPQTVTVSNTGNANMRINSISLGGQYPTQFTATNNCPIGGTGLGGGNSCTITVTFRPTSSNPATKTASITVNVALPAITQSVSLTGNVVAPTITPVLTPASGTALAFGNQQTGTTSTAQTIKVQNSPSSTANLVISSIGVASNQFAQSGCPTGGAGLAPGASCTISVTFRPTATGTANTLLTINFQSPASPSSASYQLSGTGVAPSGTLTPNPVPNFGTVKRGTTSAPQTVTFNNTGIGPITPNSISVTGQFAILTGALAGTCRVGTPVAAGGSCTINVTFNPPSGTSTGTKNGTLNVRFPNGSGSNTTVTDALSGIAN